MLPSFRLRGEGTSPLDGMAFGLKREFLSFGSVREGERKKRESERRTRSEPSFRASFDDKSGAWYSVLSVIASAYLSLAMDAFFY